MQRGDLTILVVGATGHQGGAAARHLLADGWRVRALAHHPDAPEAQSLRSQGVELVAGDLLDKVSLKAAVEGCYGVYSVESTAIAGPEGEVAEGKNIADAAADARVTHLVYSSVEGAQFDGGAAFVQSKHEIEEYIAELELPATIWRPVTFMDNFLGQKDNILGGHFKSPLWPESMSYNIAVDDIGRFIALAFSDPERFIGTSMAIAGDALPAAAIAETFSDVLGIPVEFEHEDMPGRPPVPRPDPSAPQHVRADVAECRRLIPDLLTLRDWVATLGWQAPSA